MGTSATTFENTVVNKSVLIWPQTQNLCQHNSAAAKTGPAAIVRNVVSSEEINNVQPVATKVREAPLQLPRR
jgi:hypothetical protein